MPRWEPDAQERLVGAALELFVEQGYDNTTVAQIAEHARLTKSSFFRHFPDKREVLFAGQDIFLKLPADAIASAPPDAQPLEAVGAALEALAGVFTPERHPFASTRQAVIAANSELQEREALKRADFASAMRRALRRRGVPEPSATLAAELGILAFRAAFVRWADPANDREFGELARQALQELQAAGAALTRTPAG
ncbi:MAG TPA: helix-turn-helix domain-containing protein [Solirubrobacteraceae bacterium]|jgi:AcrR family transcriptional regulator|nr:helix-turn-helix domain-containing protein [Solirubrobacteraceae bacterium]